MNDRFFCIIGAPKAGTTSLAGMLSGHPQVFFTTPKEPSYFCVDLNIQRIDCWKNYELLFSGVTKEHCAVGEGSVWYLYSEVAVEKLLERFPNAKLVIMLRNPIQMFLSWHANALRVGIEELEDPESAWRAQEARRLGRSVPVGCSEPKLLLYRDVCAVGDQVERVFGLARRSNIMTVLFDDFVADSANVYRSVIAFLGADDDGRREFVRLNEGRANRSRNVKIWLDKLGRVKKLLPFRVSTGLLRPFHRLNEIAVPKRDLSETFRAELENAFRDDIRRLEKLIERDLGRWLK